MTNYRLINEAVNLASELLEAEGIYVTNKSLTNRATKWYNHTEITDAETLAAVTISGNYDYRITYNEICEIKEFYFPTIPFEYTEISIWEIEAAQYDTLWG